jgi:crotonobetainyl-CoA:carnitine CoA-transferase CaiB-like acyl-CoA transferase
MHSVIAVLQALLHRDRTGEGQLVETNILNGGMTVNSDMYLTPSGPIARPTLDARQRGTGPLRRLYETADGWLMVSCSTQQQWERLAAQVGPPELLSDERFSTDEGRRVHAEQLGARLEPIFRTRTAKEWWSTLDAAGVPVEVSDPTYAATMFDDEDAADAGWVTAYDTPHLGLFKQIGLLVELSDSPGRVAGPPPLLGQHTAQILGEIGYSPAQVRELKAQGVVTYPDES